MSHEAKVWLITLTVLVCIPYVWGGLMRLQAWRMLRKPLPPDFLAYEGLTRWHWRGNKLIHFEWKRGRWRRTSVEPIEGKELEETP